MTAIKIWVQEGVTQDLSLSTQVGMDSHFATYGAQRLGLIGNHGFINPAVNDDDAQIFDSSAMGTYLDLLFPDPNYDGPIMLDWEGNWQSALVFGPSFGWTQEFIDHCIAEGQSAMDFIRTQRPNSEPGWYGMMLPHGSFDPLWDERAERIEPLMDPANFVVATFPSMYHEWPKPEGNFAFELDKWGAGMDLYLTWSTALGVKTYPVEWYRYIETVTPSSYSHRLIPEAEWAEGMTLGFSKDIDGIVWWGLDEEKYRNCENGVQSDLNVLCPEIPHGPNARFYDHQLDELVNHKYMDWDTYRDAMQLRRLILISNIAYGTNHPLPQIPRYISGGRGLKIGRAHV